METCLQNHQVVAVDEVDEAVLLPDAAGPGAGEHMPEWFGLPDARHGVAERRVDQPVDALGTTLDDRVATGIGDPTVTIRMRSSALVRQIRTSRRTGSGRM